MFAKKKQKAIAVLLAFTLIAGQFCSVPFTREAKASAGYTVTLTNAGNVFLCNKIPTDGPVTIEYTVATKTNVGYNREGAVVTTDPEAERPFVDGVGSMQFEEIVYLLDTDAGCTNKAVISKGGDGQAHGDFYVMGKWDNATWPLPKSTETAATTAQYFGLWFENTSDSAAGAEKLVLTNVTCTDAEGNDLGLQSYSAGCVIEGGEPEVPEEPEEPGEYKVTLENTENVFLCNRVPTDEAVTITYTVASASHAYTQGGAVATSDPTVAYPYNGDIGSMYYDNYCYLLYEGYEHEVKIEKGSSGAVNKNSTTYHVKGKTDEGFDDVPYSFSLPAGNGNKGAKYFGIWLAGSATSVVLTNVTCKDADGNDLGLQCYSEGVALEKELQAAEYDTAIAEDGYVVPEYEGITVDGEAVEVGTKLTTTGVYRVVYTSKGVTYYRTVTVTKLGDANMDAVLNLKDVMHVLKNIGQTDIGELKMKCADVNNNGELEREDANIIKALLSETMTAQEVKDTYR